MKAFSLLFVLSLFIFTSTACTKQNDESNEPQNQPATEIAEATPQQEQQTEVDTTVSISPMVFTISNVSEAEKGKPANFTWMHEGQEISFKEFTKGKVVFLNFWGTWCPPCRHEIPDIIEISNELKDKDFVVIGIALEKARTLDGAIENVKNFASSKGIPYINFIGDIGIANAYGGISSVPTTFIIDKDGNISERISGMRNKEQFMQSINRVL